MTTHTLQDLFVNREQQMDRFRRSLKGTSTRQIIVITAAAGMGKSWLLQQFANETKERNAQSVLLDFSDGHAYDVFMLVRRFRDTLNSTHFNALTQAINESTTPRLTISDSIGPRSDVNISLGSDNQIGDVTIGDIAGGNIIKDNFLVIQTDNPLILQAIEDRVTITFFECIKALTQETRVVFFFDSYERNSLETERWVSNVADCWITRQLLTRIRDDQLQNVLVVLAGRRVPAFGIEWNTVVGHLSLHPFATEDVARYLRENRKLNLSDTEIQTLYNAVQGNPQLLGIIGDNLEHANRPPTVDDEW